MSELIRKLKLVDEWLDRDEYRPTSTIRTTVAEITDEAQRLLQQTPCSTSLPPIPDWIIKYDQAGHQSSAGKAIRILMQRIKDMEKGGIA